VQAQPSNVSRAVPSVCAKLAHSIVVGPDAGGREGPVLDLVITGGAVLDGSGAPSMRADVGIASGRIVFVDANPGAHRAARQTIDATGLSVAPGFVDVHTHYDAQVFWDFACTPSSLHGVTTVFAGNCGFSIAPLLDESDYMLRLLSRVEGIPLEALQAGVPWSWHSFGEYLAAIEARGTAVNFGVMAGHSALRRAVLGSQSGNADVSAEQIQAMRELLRESLRAGAIGFSSSWATTHADGDGNPVPSRAASPDELLALCEVLAEFSGTQVEFIPTNGPFEQSHVELMTAMAVAASSPLNWNILIPRDRVSTAGRLLVSDHARVHGAHVVGLTYPDVIRSRVSFRSSAFDSIPGWAPTMALPPAAKMAALADPATRARLRAGAASSNAPTARFETLVVGETYSPSNQPFAGRRIGEIAEELGRDPLDVLCDIVLADDLRCGFIPEPPAADPEAWDVRRETWTDPRVVIGASDGGAHLDMLTTFDYPVRYLALTREHDALSLPDVVRQLTDVPARLYGLRDRGRVEPGHWADLVVFDADAVDAGPVAWRTDLPAGAGRLYSEPVGIANVIVNGVEIARSGRLTGASPGRVLRRGHDTLHPGDHRNGNA
jgi:N-acyl-D-aspartate/D-glutamate deacylase